MNLSATKFRKMFNLSKFIFIVQCVYRERGIFLKRCACAIFSSAQHGVQEKRPCMDGTVKDGHMRLGRYDGVDA